MVMVVIEREFQRGRSLDDLHAMMTSNSWCLTLHGVLPLRHYFASDGCRLVCLFEAPDAEAVRRTIITGRMRAPRRLWSATVHGQEPAGEEGDRAGPRSLVVVERSLEQPIPFDTVQALEDAAQACFEQRDVKPIVSYFALDRRRMLCLYDAPDAESVRTANRLAGLPMDIAWSTRLVLDGRGSVEPE